MGPLGRLALCAARLTATGRLLVDAPHHSQRQLTTPGSAAVAHCGATCRDALSTSSKGILVSSAAASALYCILFQSESESACCRSDLHSFKAAGCASRKRLDLNRLPAFRCRSTGEVAAAAAREEQPGTDRVAPPLLAARALLRHVFLPCARHVTSDPRSRGFADTS